MKTENKKDVLYRIMQIYKYDLTPNWEPEKFQTGGRLFLTYKQAQEFKKKLQQLSCSMKYKVEKVNN